MNTRPARPVLFLSDYGLDDEFVGIVHRIVQSAAPDVPVIDLTHQIRPHDVRAGALTLWRSAPWLQGCVVLAVVDPGVGTARRAVAVEVAGADTVLVGPDNGLLLPAAHALGPVTSAAHLRPVRPENRPVGSGSTFDGRDLFAPVAARIASGVWKVEDSGDTIDPEGLTSMTIAPPVREESGWVRCEVLWVDRFGNAQLNARPADIADLGSPLRVRTAMENAPAALRLVTAFGDLGDGEVGLLTDSCGLLALALNGSPAAEALGLREGATVRIGPAADG